MKKVIYGRLFSLKNNFTNNKFGWTVASNLSTLTMLKNQNSLLMAVM